MNSARQNIQNRQNQKKRPGRIRGLNSLRAIAVLGVLFYHAFPSWMKGGYFGVITFFVISGYLSAYRMDSMFENGKLKLGRYYGKRFLRIYPALIIVLLSSIGALTLIDSFRLANTQKEVLSIVLGYNNYWQIGMQADYFANLTNTSPFTHLWYIAILIQFDLVWPFLALLYRKVRNANGRSEALWLFFALTLASFIVMPVQILLSSPVNITAIYYSTHTRVFSLMAGAMLGLLHSENLHIAPLRFRNKWIPRFLYVAFAVLTVWIYLSVPGTNMKVYFPGLQLYTLLIAMLIEIVFLNSRHMRMFLDDRISGWLSKYSYEIYLWQYPVFFLTGIVFLNGGWLLRIGQMILLAVLSVWLSWFLSLFRRKRVG